MPVLQYVLRRYLITTCQCVVIIQVVSGSSGWEQNIKVHKSKDLLGCTDRQDVQTIFQGSHYDSNSVSFSVLGHYRGAGVCLYSTHTEGI